MTDKPQVANHRERLDSARHPEVQAEVEADSQGSPARVAVEWVAVVPAVFPDYLEVVQLADCQEVAVDYQAEVVDCQAEVADCQEAAVDYRAEVVDYRVEAVDYRAEVADYQAEVVDFQVAVVPVDCRAHHNSPQETRAHYRVEALAAQTSSTKLFRYDSNSCQLSVTSSSAFEPINGITTLGSFCESNFN